MKYRTLLYTSLLAAFQSSCMIFPIPHVSERSPALRGRLIDSHANPIHGAEIELQQIAYFKTSNEVSLISGARTTTEKDGTFRLWPRYNAHLLYYINPSFDMHWPGGSYWSGKVKVTSKEFPSQILPIDKNGDGTVRDLILTSKRPHKQP